MNIINNDRFPSKHTKTAAMNPLMMDPSPGMMKRRRSLPVLNEHIEASVVRNTALAVEGYAAGLTRGAKFLNNTEVEGSVALFHSSEIVIGELLGNGGFSKVWAVSGFNLMQTQPSAAAEKVNLARRIIESTAVDYRGMANYCIKHLDKKLLIRPDEFIAAAADLYVEAKYMSRFDHPNILKLRGMSNRGTQAFHDGCHDSFFILTDRLVDTLDKRIEFWNQEMGPRQQDLIPLKSKYALQIASALEYLHERRIVFRDLKPQNLGLKDDETVQLFDFGLCRELPEGHSYPEETFKMSAAGTKRFMAPEIYLGARYNLKADVYSYAITLYELFSHEKAYSRLSEVEFQTFVLGQGLRPKLHMYGLPHKLECLIQKAWTHSLPQRFTMKEVRQNLQAIIGEWEERQYSCVIPSDFSATIVEAPLFSSPGHIGCEPRDDELAAPVFTFEEDVVTFEKHVTFKKTSSVAEVTQATGASTELDDISISTFDCSLSSLMDLEEDLTASQARNIILAASMNDEGFEFP